MPWWALIELLTTLAELYTPYNTTVKGVYSSASVAKSSISARQGTKTLASVNILTLIQLYLVYN